MPEGNFRKLLQSQGALQSMSRKGNSWDSAVGENFIKIRKPELVYQIQNLQCYQDRIEIFEFTEIRHNKKRKHPYLDRLKSDKSILSGSIYCPVFCGKSTLEHFDKRSNQKPAIR